MKFSWLRITFMTIVTVAASFSSLPFTYNNSTFLLHGAPYQIIGGQMDPQRIPRAYWSDRLAKARAMGLNTVFSYIFWDQIEASPGSFDFTGNNDVAHYFQLAQNAGLHIVIRPGPYICGEHDWGGFPAWLSTVPGMVVRTNNEPFLAAAKSYVDRLAAELGPLYVTQGGPIIMVQLENEYGSFGSDHGYIKVLRDMFWQVFPVPLYTNDGGVQSDLAGGQISGVLAEIDGSPQSGFAARDEYVNDTSSLGPLLDGEYYITWLSTWASNVTYETDEGDASAIAGVVDDLEWILSNNDSFSIYMFHGGTNWGFQNGAVWPTNGALTPVTTSYDYGAPLDESGRTTDIYHALRNMISSYVPIESIPDIPQESPVIEISPIKVTPKVGMFDALPSAIVGKTPRNMEALGQSHGFILYRHKVVSAVHGLLQTGDAPRDRVLVYVNSRRVGVIDNIYITPAKVNLNLTAGDVLDILIENMGRVDYGPKISDQRKGIVGNVTIGRSNLLNWEMYPLSLNQPPSNYTERPSNYSTESSPPMFYKGYFDLTTIGDTFLSLPGWIKGVVWINGIIIGRHWIVGPQQTLYLPGCYLNESGNEIVVLNLEPSSNITSPRGIITRNWGNNPDPDAP